MPYDKTPRATEVHLRARAVRITRYYTMMYIPILYTLRIVLGSCNFIHKS